MSTKESTFWIPYDEAKQFVQIIDSICKPREFFKYALNEFLRSCNLEPINYQHWVRLLGRLAVEGEYIGAIDRNDVYAILYFMFGIYDPRRHPYAGNKKGTPWSEEEYLVFIHTHNGRLQMWKRQLQSLPRVAISSEEELIVTKRLLQPSDALKKFLEEALAAKARGKNQWRKFYKDNKSLFALLSKLEFIILTEENPDLAALQAILNESKDLS
jgi:hypothetical protein